MIEAQLWVSLKGYAKLKNKEVDIFDEIGSNMLCDFDIYEGEYDGKKVGLIDVYIISDSATQVASDFKRFRFFLRELCGEPLKIISMVRMSAPI